MKTEEAFFKTGNLTDFEKYIKIKKQFKELKKIFQVSPFRQMEKKKNFEIGVLKSQVDELKFNVTNLQDALTRSKREKRKNKVVLTHENQINSRMQSLAKKLEKQTKQNNIENDKNRKLLNKLRQFMKEEEFIEFRNSL